MVGAANLESEKGGLAFLPFEGVKTLWPYGLRNREIGTIIIIAGLCVIEDYQELILVNDNTDICAKEL